MLIMCSVIAIYNLITCTRLYNSFKIDKAIQVYKITCQDVISLNQMSPARADERCHCLSTSNQISWQEGSEHLEMYAQAPVRSHISKSAPLTIRLGFYYQNKPSQLRVRVLLKQKPMPQISPILGIKQRNPEDKSAN